MAGTTPAKRTPRKTVPGKGQAPVTSLASARRTRVTLDLDALDKRKVLSDLDLPKEQFTFLLDGHTYTLTDPRDSDWKLSLELARNPFLLMRHSLAGADDPVEDPTEGEMSACRERHGLSQNPPRPGTPEAEAEAVDWPDGVKPALIDRFTMTYLPPWKLDVLFKRWHEHYRIDVESGGLLSVLLGKTQ